MTPSAYEVTQILAEWRNGNQAALDQLMPLVYDELRRLAKRYMAREPQGRTLQTTVLVNEAHLRLMGQENVNCQNRTHFFVVAAQIMHHLLVDRARSRHYAKRGSGAHHIALEKAAVIAPGRDAELLALDEALGGDKKRTLNDGVVVRARASDSRVLESFKSKAPIRS